MHDLKEYRNECSRLTLGDKKLEEIITMAENEKSTLRRPTRVALLAAATAAALCVTAAAAELPAVKEFFTTVFITISANDNVAAGLILPSVSVEEREGCTILLVNGVETDVTDALARDGTYRYEGDGFEVVVDKDGVAVITAYTTDGTVVSYSTGGQEGENVTYNVVPGDGEESFAVTAGDTPGGINYGTFGVVSDEVTGSFEVTERD